MPPGSCRDSAGWFGTPGLEFTLGLADGWPLAWAEDWTAIGCEAFGLLLLSRMPTTAPTTTTAAAATISTVRRAPPPDPRPRPPDPGGGAASQIGRWSCLVPSGPVRCWSEAWPGPVRSPVRMVWVGS